MQITLVRGNFSVLGDVAIHDRRSPSELFDSPFEDSKFRFSIKRGQVKSFSCSEQTNGIFKHWLPFSASIETDIVGFSTKVTGDQSQISAETTLL